MGLVVPNVLKKILVHICSNIFTANDALKHAYDK